MLVNIIFFNPFDLIDIFNFIDHKKKRKFAKLFYYLTVKGFPERGHSFY